MSALILNISSICRHGNQTKEREANVRRVIERKSLLPRMVYLSIRSASVSLKENIEVNGSLSDPKISSELKFLLERYAKLLGFSLSDSIEVVLGVSSGVKPSSVRFYLLSNINSYFVIDFIFTCLKISKLFSSLFLQWAWTSCLKFENCASFLFQTQDHNFSKTISYKINFIIEMGLLNFQLLSCPNICSFYELDVHGLHRSKVLSRLIGLQLIS